MRLPQAAVIDANTRELYYAAHGTPGVVHEMAPKESRHCARVELFAPGLAPGQLFLVNFEHLELAPGRTSGEFIAGTA